MSYPITIRPISGGGFFETSCRYSGYSTISALRAMDSVSRCARQKSRERAATGLLRLRKIGAEQRWLGALTGYCTHHVIGTRVGWHRCTRSEGLMLVRFHFLHINGVEDRCSAFRHRVRENFQGADFRQFCVKSYAPPGRHVTFQIMDPFQSVAGILIPQHGRSYG